jgi:ubiquinone/menaquinone biosynthesis C-methylase UbiE
MSASAYVMGHNDRERRRLQLQASILNPFTEHLFRRAGICPGMEVLDIGCGVGDVSLLAARMVGRYGRVTSVDFDAEALARLNARAVAEGLENIVCTEANVHDWKPGRKFDAVVGRHILIHTKDPLETLRDCAATLQPRGLAVFHEYDFSVIHRGWPPSPEMERVIGFFNRFFGGVTHFTGSRLYTLMMEAGFDRPDCRAEYPIDGGGDSCFHEWIAESLRSTLPRAIALGVAQEGEFDVDSMERVLREEAAKTNSSIPAPAMIGAFARLRS